jgi:hypothetical protein
VISIELLGPAVVALALAPLACSGGDDDPGDGCAEPSAASIQETVFIAEGCAISSSCHDSSGHQADLDLSSVEASCAALRDVTACEDPSKLRADPDDPDESFLLQKLTCSSFSCESELGPPAETCTGVVSSARMPLNSAPLEACNIEAIRLWIESGLPGCP